TVVVILLIVALEGAVCEAKVLSLLLTDRDTGDSIRELSGNWDHHRTITLTELVWVSVSFDSCCEFLSRSQVEVLHIVGPNRGWFCARWLLGNSGKTIPCGR